MNHSGGHLGVVNNLFRDQLCVSSLSGGTDTSVIKEMFGSGAVTETRKCDHVAASDSEASEDLNRFTPFSYQSDRIKPNPPRASRPLRTLTPKNRQLAAQTFYRVSSFRENNFFLFGLSLNECLIDWLACVTIIILSSKIHLYLSQANLV